MNIYNNLYNEHVSVLAVTTVGVGGNLVKRPLSTTIVEIKN